jgi:N-methylhydantoinase A/oxoprolinase/acetone carboxylase beta subunit
MAIALGIDTGGTYTDAVLVEYENNHVLAEAKALTTKYDLAIGIRQAIERVLQAQPADVRLVSLSTTLATNAIVEGNGAPICALLIGYDGRLASQVDLQRELGTARYALIPGGHLDNGEEWEPLDLAAARTAILEHAPHVAAFAISGYFGTRNPEHELAVKRLVQQLAGVPATCGHELTHRLDALRRATTVALNARLIPLLCELMDAVELAMREHGIVAPLMVVKGDGSLMDSSMARERPIETILSGPAASVVGAQHLAGGAESIVVDMGGTTTDIAVIKEGRPRLNPQGARVGPWRTMVEAIDVHTVGLGGDSHVWLDESSTLTVGPRRVVPLCLLATEHPEVLDVLRRQAAPAKKLDLSYGEFLLFQREGIARDVDAPPFAAQLLDALRRGPCSLDRVYQFMAHPGLYVRYLDRLERQGIVTRSGFTPTDAAHVLGEYRAWDTEAACLAATILARRLNLEVESLCRRVLALTSERIATEVVTKLLGDDGVNGDHEVVDSALITRALRPSTALNLHCTISVRPAIVAIGAPVQTYFPEVARLLHGELRIPEHTGVANALGAVAGSVLQRAHILVVPQDEGTHFRVHLPEEVCDFMNLADAIAYAEEQGEQLAHSAAQRAGAENIQVKVSRHDQSAPVASGWGEEVYLRSLIEATAIGRPRLAHR